MMTVDSQMVANAIAHARSVSGYYAQLPVQFSGGKKTPDGLRIICKDYIRKSVEIFVIEKTPNSVRALYMAREEGYAVFVLSNQDRIWRDFAACKELFHVILDDPDAEDCRTIKLFDHVEELVKTLIPFNGHPTPTAVSEFLAELAAMEFLFPYSERMSILAGGDVNCAVIANQYNLPLVLVERYLSDGFMQGLQEHHQSDSTT